MDYCYWKISKEKTLNFLTELQKENSISTYRKKVLQIRRFLKYLNIGYLDKLKIISEPVYTPKRIATSDIIATLAYFKNNKKYYKQIKALVLLGITSGLRAHELYQLIPEDIDLENRIVYINNDSSKGQSTKTGASRVSFFTIRAQKALKDFLEDFQNTPKLGFLFGRSHLINLFRKAPIQVKDLRKVFSQEWTRRNGNYAAKEILLGHSIKKSVDLQHYTILDENDLKRIYDKVMK